MDGFPELTIGEVARRAGVATSSIRYYERIGPGGRLHAVAKPFSDSDRGTTLMEAPFLQPTLQFMQQLGAPWTFSTDTPAALVEGRGWTARVTDVAEPGNEWHRWEHPAVPLHVAGVPRGYFIEATKA